MADIRFATTADHAAIAHLCLARNPIGAAIAPRAAAAARRSSPAQELIMSRYDLKPKPNSGAIIVVVGWDRPLRSFLAQVFTPTVDEPEEGEATIWLGTEPGELPTAEAAIAVVAPYVEIPATLAADLNGDMRATVGVKDRARQAAAQRGLFGSIH